MNSRATIDLHDSISIDISSCTNLNFGNRLGLVCSCVDIHIYIYMHSQPSNQGAKNHKIDILTMMMVERVNVVKSVNTNSTQTSNGNK